MNQKRNLGYRDKLFLKIVGVTEKTAIKFIQIFGFLVLGILLLILNIFTIKEHNSLLFLFIILIYALFNIIIIIRNILKNNSFLLSIYWFTLSIIVEIVLFAEVYYEYGISNCNEANCSFLTYIYFSIVTWTTLGYGDFHPIKETQIFAGLEAILGYIYMGLFVGVIIAGIQKKYST